MKRSFVVTAVFTVLALMVFMPTASHAKRGMPDYVVEKSCGDNDTVAPSILIAFATNYGSTYRVAEVIAEVLCGEGFHVDMLFAKNVTGADLAGRDAVILGSSIYIEEWHPEALAFLEDNQADLDSIPLAYYCVNGLLGMNFDTKEELVDEHYIQPMYGRFNLNPLDVTAFAGAVDYRILKPKDWFMLHLMFMPKGNWTNYAEVVAWSFELMELFKK